MTKQELVEYLASLHLLMEGQERAGLSKSKILLGEYDKHWDMLKATIEKESDDETRKRSNLGKRHEAGADLERDRSGTSS